MGIHNNKNTEADILEAGKKEFLTYGYERASLRRIAKEASVTTGAIYGYFSGKEALFQALTEETADELVELYRKVHEIFAALPPHEQPGALMTVTDDYIPWMINYIYDHYDVFKLILCSGAPGAGEKFFEKLAGIEEQSCRDMIEALKSIGHSVPELRESLIHIICHTFFRQIQEFVSHDISREEALECALTLGKFQHAGWVYILKLEELL